MMDGNPTDMRRKQSFILGIVYNCIMSHNLVA